MSKTGKKKKYCLGSLSSFTEPYLSKSSSYSLITANVKDCPNFQTFLHKSSTLFNDFNGNKLNSNITKFFDRTINNHVQHDFQVITNRVCVEAFSLSHRVFLVFFYIYLRKYRVIWKLIWLRIQVDTLSCSFSCCFSVPKSRGGHIKVTYNLKLTRVETIYLK